MTVTYHVGDTRTWTSRIPDGSISLVASSPPFIALRSYLPADHPDKHAEIGSEPDPATFIDTLLALTAEWGRVLAPWGSIAIELGDTYSGSGGAGGDYNEGGLREGQMAFNGSAAKRAAQGIGDDYRPTRAGRDARAWPRAKCLALVPQAYALSLAYGRNVLNGNESPAGRWLVRNVITWHRPNPAVGALGDKYRPSTSQIVVATRSAKRWFDLTAVRNSDATLSKPGGIPRGSINGTDETRRLLGEAAMASPPNPAGAPPLDCWLDEYDGHDTWTITTQPSSLAHYAMWPAKLAERLILSMCPAQVCTQCGEPRRRLETSVLVGIGGTRGGKADTLGNTTTMERTRSEPTTTGWSDCGCGAPWTAGTVLDPFAGTGTTLAVADLHGRNAIGIDIDARNPELYQARRAECSRNLFDSPPVDPAQLDLFGAAS